MALWVKDKDVAKRTFESYSEIIRNHLIPKLGEVSLQDLQPIQIQNYVRDAKENGRIDGKGGLSPRTTEYHIAILKMALNDAVKLDILLKNPCQQIEVKSNKKNSSDTHKVYIPSVNELNQLLIRVKKTNIYIPTLIAVSTGMRLGEVLGLRWKDIDFYNRTISIQQAVKREEGKIKLGALKTAGSRRTISFDQILLNELRIHKTKQRANKLSMGSNYINNDLVCANEDGSKRNSGTVSSRFRRLARTINLPISFHDLRHTHATMLFEAGVSSKIIQERLGHYDVAFTLRTYVHNRESSSVAADCSKILCITKRRPGKLFSVRM